MVLPVWESSSVGRDEATRWRTRRFHTARIGTGLERRLAENLQPRFTESALGALRSAIGRAFPDKK